MAQPVYIDNDRAGTVIPFIPVLIPPGYAAYEVWVALSAQGWHPVFKLLCCGGVVAAMIYAFVLMYRYLPMFLSVGLTVAYMAAVYWWTASHFINDPIWLGAIAVSAALVGFFGGRKLAREEIRAAA
jgi:hypothetical protein